MIDTAIVYKIIEVIIKTIDNRNGKKDILQFQLSNINYNKN